MFIWRFMHFKFYGYRQENKLISHTCFCCLRVCPGEDRLCVSADVGEDDRLDRQPAHRTQLVPLLQLPGADVAGYEVSGPSVDDAAVLRPGLTDETRVQARLRQAPLRRHAALQIRDGGKRSRHAALQIGDKWRRWW